MDVKTAPVEIELPTLPALPDPKPIQQTPFKWEVLTPDKLPDDERWVRYGLTVKDYEALARNMAEILRWVKEAEWRLRYYRGEGEVDDVQTEQEQPQ